MGRWATSAALLLWACHRVADGGASAAAAKGDCEPMVLGAKPGVVAGKPVVIVVYDSSRFRLERTEGATVAKELDSDAVGLRVQSDPFVLHFTDMQCRTKLVARMSASDPSNVSIEVEE